ncbi:MAG TPA: V-type ATP synthase subunit E family protein [bacterium]|nr:V-type ATP synthase subunit E family protein [bacterium]
MDIEKYTEDTEQIKEISRRIQEEADYQARDIIQQAKQESENILNIAQQQIASERTKKMADLELELKQMREHIFSSLNLEKRRIELKEKERFIKKILEEVELQAKSFRTSEEYPNFLMKDILEGISVLDKEELRVIYSSLDEAIFTEAFLQKLSEECHKQLGKKVILHPEKGDFSDIGVKLQSMDGRIVFDNTFSARLARMQNEIYNRLLKEN